MATFNAGSIEATLDLDVDPFQRGIREARAEGRKFGREKFTAKLELDTGNAYGDASVLRREFQRLAKTYTAELEVNGLGESVAEVQTLNAELAALGDRHTIDIDIQAASANIGQVRRGVRQLIPALAILATGLTPLSAAAVPVLGLAQSMAFAAGAGGSLILAFQGIGGALKAANEAGIDPSAENLEKLHAAMSALTPAGRDFVGVLRDMRTEASGLQDAAQNGLFPGLTGGLETVELDRYVGLIYELSNATGELAREGLTALGDTRWTTFFGFLESEARPSINDLGDAVGNLAGFFASLWQAFDPLNDDFSDWLVSSTAALRGWADSLPDDPAMADFIAYVREQGPQAGEALESIFNALVQIVEASAPLGGVVLDSLEALGDAIAFIADQPFGDELLLGAAGLYTLNTALRVTEGLMTRMGMTGAAAAVSGATGGGIFGAIGDKATTARTGLRGFTSDLKAMRAEYPRSNRVAATFLSGLSQTTPAAQRASGAIGGVGRAVGKYGAIAAGVTVLSTGVADSLGLTTTAMGALTGFMVGGAAGAVAGGAVGAFLDLRKAAHSAEDAQKAFNRAVDNQFTSVSQYQTALVDLRDAHDAYASSVTGFLMTGVQAIASDPLAVLLPGGKTPGIGDTALGDMLEQEKLAEQATGDLKLAAHELGLQMGMTGIDTATLDTALRNAQPAMAALEISSKDLIAGIHDGSIVDMVDQITQWQINADSAAGRTDTFAKSVADLGEDALSTAASAAAMGDALEALLSPQLNAEEATDAWHQSLKALEEDLKAGAGFKGFGDAAIENKQITRDYVTTSMDRLKALAGLSTTTEKDMANAVARTRKEFIASGIAAGFSRKEIAARATALGLTPKLIRTVFHAAGITQVDLRARQLTETYKGLPKDVRTDIKANGIPATSGQVDRLVKKYELTEKQRQALITLKDLAGKPLGDVLNRLGIFDHTTAQATITVAAGNALDIIRATSQALFNLDGNTANTTIYTHRVESREKRAGGGPIIGIGTGTSDSIPIAASNGEHMWTAREVANAGGHAAVEDIRRQFRYAAGGAIEWANRSRNGALGSRTVASVRSTQRTASGTGGSDADRIVRAIRDNRGLYVAVSSREDLETALRLLESELRRR